MKGKYEMEIYEAQQKIKDLAGAIVRIENKAQDEGRGMNGKELTLRAEMQGTIKELSKYLPEKALTLQGFGGSGGAYDSDIMVFQDLEGHNIPAFSNNKRFASLTKGQELEGIGPESLGKILRAKILGDSYGLSHGEIRAMSEGVGGAGGWFVSPQLSSYVIDLARNKSCVLQAGAWTLPVETAEITLVKVLTDPTGYWVQEGSKITESEGTFAPVKMKMIVLGALVRVSRALLEDAPNSGQVIESQLAAALGLELDRVCLLGNGVSEPKGLAHCADINSYSMGVNGAALTDYDPFSYASEYIFTDNGIPGAVIYAPRTGGALDRLKETGTAAPLTPPPSFQVLQKFQTNQVPINQTQGTSSVASSAFVGDYKNIILGMRRQLTIDTAPYGVGSGSKDVFSTVEVLIRGYLRVDVAILREEHFTWIKGIL
ncbi:MAG: phage major capsid protein [Proteobacteria bacterium]|jgi:HK97 family phage major capsid protein|nr:phage major capsid protein [Pseudomonadota bacterium]